MKRLTLIGVALAAALHVSAAEAQWQTSGPPAGHVVSMAMAPDATTVWVGLDEGGLFASHDGGVTFSALTNLPQGNATAIAFDPVVTGRVYVAFQSGNGSVLHVSTDGGATFSQLATFLDGVSVIEVDPTLSNRLYVSADFAGTWRSDNGGATFVGLDALLAFDPITSAVAVDPTNPQRVYLDVDWGVAVSDDAGMTIDVASTSPLRVTSIVVDPANASIVYAASSDSIDGGVHRSTDGGTTWAPLAALAGQPVGALALAPDGRLYAAMLTGFAAVQISDDGGTTWTAAAQGLVERWPTQLEVAASKVLLGGRHGGVHRSLDGATSWTHVGDGLLGAFVASTALTSTGMVVSAEGAGLFRSSDGASWTRSSQGLPSMDVHALAASPTSADVVFAGTAGAGVFRSADGGQTWSASSTGAADVTVHTLAIDPAAPSTMYLGTDQRHLVAGEPHLYKSLDGGQSWSALEPGVIDGEINALLVAEGRLFAATGDDGLWVSADGGQSFAPANQGADTYGQYLLSLAYQPLSGRLFQGQHGGGLGRSDDLGAHWLVSDQGLPGFWLSALRPHPTDPNVLYVGTVLDGMAISHNGGVSFAPFATELGDVDVRAIDVTPQGLAISTHGHGVLYEAPTTPGTGGGGAGGEGGVGGAGGEGGAGGAAVDPAGAGGSTPTTPPQTSDRDAAAGCGCRIGQPSFSGASWLFALALGLGLGRRRRARR
ncbi:MAG: MYXO-CTERM sorting domain-containing protein [Polyangiaceae bacterium]